MVKELVTKAEFARRANVSAAAVSKACALSLAPATVGLKIDAKHAAALAYIDLHSPQRINNQPEPMAGIDPLYPDAVALAVELGRTSTREFMRRFSIGNTRAMRLAQLIDAGGVLNRPNPVATKPKAKPVAAVPIVTFDDEGTLKLGGEILRAGVAIADLKTHEDVTDLPPSDEFPGEAIEDLSDLTLKELCNKYGTAERFKSWLQARKTIVDIGAKEIANAEKRGKLIPREFVEAHLIGNFDRAHINLMTDAAQTIARRLVGDIKAGATPEECEIFVSEQISRHIKEAKATIMRNLSNV